MLNIDWKLIAENNPETLKKFLEYLTVDQEISNITTMDVTLGYYDGDGYYTGKLCVYLNSDLLKILDFFDQYGLHLNCVAHKFGGVICYAIEMYMEDWSQCGIPKRSEALKRGIERAFGELKPYLKINDILNQITDDNSPEYQVGVLLNIESVMPRPKRNRITNVEMVKKYLSDHITKGGHITATSHCKFLGVNPHAHTFIK